MQRLLFGQGQMIAGRQTLQSGAVCPSCAVLKVLSQWRKAENSANRNMP
jgi:Zn ribbon nucleic-acid-binding protein